MVERLRALRATTGLSQEAFANEVGLNYKQWGNFEAGSRIGLDAAITLVRKKHVTLDWIYFGDDGSLRKDVAKAIESKMQKPAESA